MENFIFYAFIVIVVGFVMNLANKKSNIKVKPDHNGKTYLKMNKIYFFGGLFSIFIWALFSIILFSSEEIDLKSFLKIFGIISIIFLGSGIPSLLWYVNHSVTYDQKEILVKNVFGKEKIICISKIVSSEINIFTGLLKVKTDIETVKIHQHLVGVKELTKTIINVA